MLMSNAAVSFDLSGVPFVGDNIDTSLQFSKTVPRDKEMNHCNQKHYRRTGWRRKAKSRVSIRQYDHGAPARVGQHYFSSLDQNPKTRFLLTSSFNNEPFSASFEAARSCKIPSPEKVDSALDNKKITNLRHCRRFRKRGKGGRYDVTLTAFSLQLQSDFNANHSSAIRIPANLDSPNCSDIGKRGKEINMAREQKMKCLKSEVHKSHSADTASLPGSFVHKVGRALRSPFRKKLLVLDLNGILCDVVLGCHRSCLPHKQVNRRSVFKRPFLNDFLSFCFERFVVGIWSSRNKYNVMGVVSYVMGDSKDRLLFCWDQSKCTVTGFNTIENRHKPLMLKELTKLWNKEEASLPWEKGEFSPSNTLLVDDSPYKALCNPLHTAIFPFPYDFQHEGDSALGPGGAIRVYLESIAMADDVQEHVKKHSFGQGAITSKDQMWSFYKNVIDKKNSMASR